MTKSESLIKLEELGLNTLPCFITEHKQEMLTYIAKHNSELISMRTEKGSNYLCPFYFMIKGEELIQPALIHLNEGYRLIFSPSLDTKDCLAFGTVALTGKAENIMEFVIGPGKVRELDTHPNLQSHRIKIPKLAPFLAKDIGNMAPLLNALYKKVERTCDKEIPCIVEWSLYSYGVGRLHTPDIYWEIREF